MRKILPALMLPVLILSALIACGGGGGGNGGGGDAGGNNPPPPENLAPDIESISDQQVIEGEVISVLVNASDPDGSISAYQWRQISGPVVTLTDSNNPQVTITAPAVDSNATAVLEVSVTDNEGAISSAEVSLTITNSQFSKSPHRVNFFNDQDLSQFFYFFDHQNINQIELVITQAEWDAFIAELTENLRSDIYFRANAIISNDLGSESIEQVGFRIRGNTTRQLPYQDGEFKPVHFKIKFNETFDIPEETLPYLERDERRYANLRALNLKNRRPGYDDSQIRELYGYDLFNQAGIAAPLTGSVQLKLTIGGNTVNYGIYTAIEPIDKTFLRKRYGDIENEGDLYKCLWATGGPATLTQKHPNVSEQNWIGISDDLGFDPSYDLKTNKSTSTHAALIDFIDQLNSLNGGALKSYLDANFEVEQFLKTIAMNVIVGNADDYWAMGNNYYLYFKPQGKLVFVPYDYDKAFGDGSEIITETADIFVWFNRSGEITGDPFYDAHPLVDKLLEISAYRELYISYLAEYTDLDSGNFNFARYSAKFDQLKLLYDADGDGQLSSDIPDNVPSMNNQQQAYFETKIESVRSQIGL